MSEKVRRLIGLFLALTLSLTGVVQGVQASDMAVKMSAASIGDMPTPDGCSGCNGDDGMPMACSAVCGTSVPAILPTSPVVAPRSPLSLPVALVASVVEHHGPPDPYPPRPISVG